MARIFREQELCSVCVNQITLLAEYEGDDTVELPKNENQYSVIYNCGQPQGFYINYTLYELKQDEILFFDSDAVLTGKARSEGRNTHFYVLSFKNGDGFLSLDDDVRNRLFVHISKYLVMRSRGNADLRHYFSLGFKDYGALPHELFLKSCIPFIFSELIKCCDYHSMNGADWTEAREADALQIYMENGAYPVRLILRIDVPDKNGHIYCAGSTDTYLIDENETRVSKEQGSPHLTIPAHFKGYYIMPLDGNFVDLPGDGKCRPVKPDLTCVSRLMFYFYGAEEEECHAGTSVRIGAFTLVKTGIVGNREFVRSLSYYTNMREEKILNEEHFGKLFNKVYYGARVEFNGFITITLEHKGLAIISTVMGAEKNAASQLPDDIAAALDYIHMHFGEELSIDTLAGCAYLSESRFKNKFHTVVGMTPMKYVEYVRIKAAKDALNTNKREITALAYELGYSSPSHFAAAFKRQTGVTPSGYLKQRQVSSVRSSL